MKTRILALLLFTLPASVLAQSTSPTKAPRQAAIDVVTAFIKGTDTRNVEQVDATWKPEAVLFAATPNGALVVSKTDFLTSLGEDKIGGQDRSLEIKMVDVTDGTTAVVHAIAAGPTARFSHYITLMEDNEKWIITGIQISMTPL